MFHIAMIMEHFQHRCAEFVIENTTSFAEIMHNEDPGSCVFSL